MTAAIESLKPVKDPCAEMEIIICRSCHPEVFVTERCCCRPILEATTQTQRRKWPGCLSATHKHTTCLLAPWLTPLALNALRPSICSPCPCTTRPCGPPQPLACSAQPPEARPRTFPRCLSFRQESSSLSVSESCGHMDLGAPRILFALVLFAARELTASLSGWRRSSE